MPLFSEGFENDAVETAYVVNGVDLTPTGAAALTGSFGLSIVKDADSETGYVLTGVYAPSGTDTTHSIDINPNSSLATGESIDLVRVYDNNLQIAVLQIKNNAGTYQARAGAFTSSWTHSGWTNISESAEQTLKLEFRTGSAGFAQVTTSSATVTTGGLDNSGHSATQTRFGISAIESASSGTFFIDVLDVDNGISGAPELSVNSGLTKHSGLQSFSISQISTPAPVSGNAEMETVRVAANTSSGNQDITGSFSETPTGVIFLISSATTDDTAADDAFLSIGAATGSGEQWALCAGSESGQTDTDTSSISKTDKCIVILVTGGSIIDGEASFVEFIAGGVRVNWSDEPGSAYLITAMFIYGSDTDCKALDFNPGTTVSGTVDVTTVGFEADWLMVVNNGELKDTSLGRWQHGIGFVVNDGSDTQFGWASRESVGETSGAPLAHLSDSAAGLTLSSIGATSKETSIGSFDSSGFTATVDSGTSDVDYLCFAVKMDNTDIDLSLEDSPTSTGDVTYTALNKKPQAMIALITHLTAIDTAVTTEDAGAMGLSFVGETSQFSQSYAIEDASDTTDTQSLNDNQAINVPIDDGGTGLEATLSTFGTTGPTLSWTQVLGSARKMIFLTVEAPVTVVTSAASEQLGGTNNTATDLITVPVSAVFDSEDASTIADLVTVPVTGQATVGKSKSVSTDGLDVLSAGEATGIGYGIANQPIKTITGSGLASAAGHGLSTFTIAVPSQGQTQHADSSLADWLRVVVASASTKAILVALSNSILSTSSTAEVKQPEDVSVAADSNTVPSEGQTEQVSSASTGIDVGAVTNSVGYNKGYGVSVSSITVSGATTGKQFPLREAITNGTNTVVSAAQTYQGKDSSLTDLITIAQQTALGYSRGFGINDPTPVVANTAMTTMSGFGTSNASGSVTASGSTTLGGHGTYTDKTKPVTKVIFKFQPRRLEFSMTSKGLPVELINEKSAADITITPKAKDGTVQMPISFFYVITDDATGDEIKGKTEITDLSGDTITVSTTVTDNTLLSQDNIYETRVLTVRAIYSSGVDEVIEAYRYEVRNLDAVSAGAALLV